MLIFEEFRMIFMQVFLKHNQSVFDFNFIPIFYGAGKSSISRTIKKAFKIIEFQLTVFSPFFIESLNCNAFRL
ncbi:hypothetical protein IIF7_08231 [Zunongwangia atlantica 22II14-10F7]|uniref:Uncharacterized protein n=1 Tax=Zunongwangia atlantica 22II14-10F7 TaxID=1185767 RepID=A0A1Y1T6P1_9FLAO|nr:hypothetical protein IIF7_08231 [Zunongwangia atlantica 22II14-10F7]